MERAQIERLRLGWGLGVLGSGRCPSQGRVRRRRSGCRCVAHSPDPGLVTYASSAWPSAAKPPPRNSARRDHTVSLSLRVYAHFVCSLSRRGIQVRQPRPHTRRHATSTVNTTSRPARRTQPGYASVPRTAQQDNGVVCVWCVALVRERWRAEGGCGEAPVLVVGSNARERVFQSEES